MKLGAQSILILAISATSCGGKAKQPTPEPRANATPVAATPAAATAKPASPHVGVSEDLAKQCSLQLANAEKAPKFGFDDSELLPEDRSVLQQIADCLIQGPLKGRTVQLVGHTDPRGTDEYNLGLGTRRAETVRSYLQRLGVPSHRLSPTTRGELDASGTDDATWQRDRRVDLQLVN